MSYRLIAEGNWKRPLDLNVLATQKGELHMPFARHVHQQCTEPGISSPFPYLKLPAELQLHILDFCDQPSLFQLMHTSHRLRTGSKKLFFSHPQAWYYLKAEWILDGGHPGHSLHDTGFLLFVQRVELDLVWLNGKTFRKEISHNYWTGIDVWSDMRSEDVAKIHRRMQPRIHDFWRVVQQRLPSVKHVILSDDRDRSTFTDYITQMPPTIFKTVARACPPGTEVYVSLAQGNGSSRGRLKRALWRLVERNSPMNAVSDWEAQPNRIEPVIIPPYKSLYGPVGKFLGMRIQSKVYEGYIKMRRVMRLAAIEKMHFDNEGGRHEPFTCPAPNCDVVFDQPEQYTTHCLSRSHDKYAELPKPFKSALEVKSREMEIYLAAWEERHKALRTCWGRLRSEERAIAEREFLGQLEEDQAYRQDESVEKHRVLMDVYRILDRMMVDGIL